MPNINTAVQLSETVGFLQIKDFFLSFSVSTRRHKVITITVIYGVPKQLWVLAGSLSAGRQRRESGT